MYIYQCLKCKLQEDGQFSDNTALFSVFLRRIIIFRQGIMTIFSGSGIAKAYNDKVLFEDISFGMETGERIGIIGKNGAGKTTLMKIVAGLVEPDTGEIVFNSGVRREYLEQDPQFDSFDIVIDYVMKGRAEIAASLERYAELCKIIHSDSNPVNSTEFDTIIRFLDHHNGWAFESEAKKILSQLGMYDFARPVSELSGGLKKRTALARALISNPELLILDEPTNHLDADTVQWLQDRMNEFNNSMLFVTHDRYFLDAVATKIIEIDRKRLFTFPGNYEYYLEKKEAVAAAQDAAIGHIRSKLRMELAWLQKGAKARRTKSKSRIDWIKLMEEDSYKIKEKKIKIEVGKTFIGSRVIEANFITKEIGGRTLFRDFTYVAAPGDRIGIIGPNGCGKTTLLNVLSGNDSCSAGHVKFGATIKIGYFRQEIVGLRDNQTVIRALREVAEYIDVGVGRDRYLTTRDLLEKFLFPGSMHNSFISTLSGGEKKRLALIKLLMGNPNVLLLDEPTNDFDIATMNALEDYLDNFYGTLLVVSHDRAFLDRVVNTIFCFGAEGIVKEYPGNYSEYLERKESAHRQKPVPIGDTDIKVRREKDPAPKRKLTFREQQEYDNLELEIPKLEEKKQQLEETINSGSITDYKELDGLSRQLAILGIDIEEKTMRWLEISELMELLKG